MRIEKYLLVLEVQRFIEFDKNSFSREVGEGSNK